MPNITNGQQTSQSRENGNARIDEILDPFCNPDDPVVVGWGRVEDAVEKIRGGVIRTPCTKTRLSERLEIELYFKKEYMQFTGSFKDRGALYALLKLTPEERNQGVVTTSAGNHAQALAYQGAKLSIPVTVVMPRQAPLVKVDSCRNLKANVILHGAHFNEARAFAMAYGKQHNLLYINGYDHPDILAGQGSVGVEILEDVPDVEYVIVPVGGGGLIAGICAAIKFLKPQVKIIGVESDRCPSWNTAIMNGRPISCMESLNGAKNSIADGLSVIEVGHNSFATANPVVDKVVTISEDFIALAILRLLEHEKSVVEGAGAAGFAAIIANKLPELKGKNNNWLSGLLQEEYDLKHSQLAKSFLFTFSYVDVESITVCVLCGGNIDVTVLGRVIDRALMMDGRLCRFTCIISDRAGGLANLLGILALAGASVKDILHDRMSLPAFVYKTLVRCTVETRDADHAKDLHAVLLKEFGKDLHWKLD